MLPCNNTAIAGGSVIISRMSDADELARRYLALWTEYLSALVADPQAAELLQRWLAVTGQFAKAAGEHAGAFAWPPVPPVGSPADAAAAAGASGERDAVMGKLARRVAELERRLAALEPEPKPARAGKRDRKSRAGSRRPGA
jgi:hypothetical protein